MFNFGQKDNTISKAWILAILAICTIFSAQALASKMATQLQEAIYLFEMKGEVDDAIRLLEKVSRQGDADDKESAFFYLGKIYDMASNKAQANHLCSCLDRHFQGQEERGWQRMGWLDDATNSVYMNLSKL